MYKVLTNVCGYYLVSKAFDMFHSRQNKRRIKRLKAEKADLETARVRYEEATRQIDNDDIVEDFII